MSQVMNEIRLNKLVAKYKETNRIDKSSIKTNRRVMHTCPRRIDIGRLSSTTRNEDSYDIDGACTFCGSLSGDEFIARVRDGELVWPNERDKNYKVSISGRRMYLCHLSHEQQELFVQMYTSGAMYVKGGVFNIPPYFMKVDK